MTSWILRDDGGDTSFAADTREAARTTAEAMMRAGDWEPCEETWWAHAWLVELDADGDELDADERLTVAIEPRAPKCSDGPP